MTKRMLAIWSLVPLPFLKPAWTSGNSQFKYCWSLAAHIAEAPRWISLIPSIFFISTLFSLFPLPTISCLTCNQLSYHFPVKPLQAVFLTCFQFILHILTMCVLVTWLCPTLCNSMNYIACQASLSMELSRQGYWSGLQFLPPEDLPDPGIEPWSSASQADYLPLELHGSPILAIEPFKNLKSYHAILLSLNFLVDSYWTWRGLPRWLSGKESAC